MTRLADEGLTWRIGKAVEARRTAAAGPQEQKTEAIVAPNGVNLTARNWTGRARLRDQIDFTAWWASPALTPEFAPYAA